MKSSANILRNAGKSGTAAASSQLCSSLRRPSSVLGFEFEVLGAFADPNAAYRRKPPGPMPLTSSAYTTPLKLISTRPHSRVDTNANYRVPELFRGSPLAYRPLDDSGMRSEE